jgi:hypothetical protein
MRQRRRRELMRERAVTAECGGASPDCCRFEKLSA